MKLNLTRLLAFFSRKERRKNRPVEVVPTKLIRQVARMRKTLVDIANVTKREMPDDDEFRQWAQDECHIAIECAGMIR